MKLTTFRFSVDKLSFEDLTGEVYALSDISKASIDGSYEVAERRGGPGNEIRATAIHSRKAKLSIESAIVDFELAKLLSGGTLTSTTTPSAAAISTALTNRYGTTTTLQTAITSVTVSTASLVKSDRYHIEAVTNSTVKVTRVSDGVVIGTYALTPSATIVLGSEGISLGTGATGTSALTVGEKSYFESRSATTGINQIIKFDSNKPVKLTANVTVDHNGVRTRVRIPNVQPVGHMEQFESDKFALKSMEMPIFYDETLDQLYQISITG